MWVYHVIRLCFGICECSVVALFKDASVTYTVFQFINLNAFKNLPCKVVYTETLQHVLIKRRVIIH